MYRLSDRRVATSGCGCYGPYGRLGGLILLFVACSVATAACDGSARSEPSSQTTSHFQVATTLSGVASNAIVIPRYGKQVSIVDGLIHILAEPLQAVESQCGTAFGSPTQLANLLDTGPLRLDLAMYIVDGQTGNYLNCQYSLVGSAKVHVHCEVANAEITSPGQDSGSVAVVDGTGWAQLVVEGRTVNFSGRVLQWLNSVAARADIS